MADRLDLLHQSCRNPVQLARELISCRDETESLRRERDAALALLKDAHDLLSLRAPGHPVTDRIKKRLEAFQWR